jgi:oxygen-dependent protoporphyrinogen oxidase
MKRRVAVIGGGISGLTTAFLLKRRDIDITLFEARDAVGGNIQTLHRDDYTIELGPNSLIRSAKLIELIKLLDIEGEVLPADAAAKKRYILYGGKLQAMGPAAMLNGYFSPRALLGLIGEPIVRTRSPRHESVAEFVSRRIGREFLDKAVDPFVSGIYAGDPADLSIKSAFPKLYDLERNFGSLIVGTFRRKKENLDPAFPRTFSFRGGLETWVKALERRLGEDIKYGSTVTAIDDTGEGKFAIEGETFGAAIISTPSNIAARLIESRDSVLAKKLTEVNYPPLAVVILGLESGKIEAELDGFGFLVASKENRKILGTLYHSAVFPERAPKGRQVLVSFVGGVRSGGILDQMSDDDLVAMVMGELRDILGVAGEPELVHIQRWPRAIPQYRVGYEDIIDECSVFMSAHPGLYFCSNFYRGVSMGDCVKNAFETADDIENYLRDGSIK